jgi:hypothetical protein
VKDQSRDAPTSSEIQDGTWSSPQDRFSGGNETEPVIDLIMDRHTAQEPLLGRAVKCINDLASYPGVEPRQQLVSVHGSLASRQGKPSMIVGPWVDPHCGPKGCL